MRRSTVALLALLAPLLCGISYCQQATLSEPISLCELGSQYEQYDGKVIRLKSDYIVSTHGSAVVDERCRDVLIGGYKWRNTVCLKTSPESNTKTGVGLFSDIADLIIKWHELAMKTHLEVVFVGRLEVIKERSPLYVRDGYAGGTGFCISRQKPFILHIDKVESITFKATLAPTPQVGAP